jgi:hypothetical protein
MTLLITICQKKEWTEYVRKSIGYDFYHTWYYHSLDNSGEPFLFVYQEAANFIAIPLVKRKIKNSSLFDLTSVYGYTGPISNQSFEEMNDDLMENFKISFLSFLKIERNISVFSRLHPFFNQKVLIEKFGGIYENGKTVAIDLTLPIEKQRSNYRKSVLVSIKRSWEKSHCIKETNSLQDIRVFAGIYAENMNRIGAASSYLFDEQYFIDFLRADEFKSKLLLVYDKDMAICGTIITCTNDIIEGHLIATKTEFIKESPAKLLVDEISVIGRRLGMKYYHLGGGLAYKEDSLFHWKTGFSDLFFNYYSWRYIADEPAYKSLVLNLGINPSSDIDYFPLYRTAT